MRNEAISVNRWYYADFFTKTVGAFYWLVPCFPVDTLVWADIFFIFKASVNI